MERKKVGPPEELQRLLPVSSSVAAEQQARPELTF